MKSDDLGFVECRSNVLLDVGVVYVRSTKRINACPLTLIVVVIPVAVFVPTEAKHINLENVFRPNLISIN